MASKLQKLKRRLKHCDKHNRSTVLHLQLAIARLELEPTLRKLPEPAAKLMRKAQKYKDIVEVTKVLLEELDTYTVGSTGATLGLPASTPCTVTFADMKQARKAQYKAIGPRPGKLHVLHRCDNRKCATPEHLFWGTATDNMRDAVLKGRHSRQTHGYTTVEEVLKFKRGQLEYQLYYYERARDRAVDALSSLMGS